MSAMCRWLKLASLSLTGCLFASGSCLPDNLWADILGVTLVDGVVAALRNSVLVGLGLQTP